MRWKYCLPEPWSSHDNRVAYEEICVRPEEEREDAATYWLSVETLQSRTGGTREDKLRRLGEREYIIDDTLDMLVRKEDIDLDELLRLACEIIRARLADPDPQLIEAEEEEFPGAFCISGAEISPLPTAHHTKLLFVFYPSHLQTHTPDSLLPADHRLEIRSISLDEGASTPLSSADVIWADLIIVMDKKVRSLVHKFCRTLGVEKRIICLYLSEHRAVSDPRYAEAVVARLRVYLIRMGILTA